MWGLSSCGVQAPECSGSVVVAHRLSYSHSMWDLGSLTREWACVPCIARQILNHWTIREVPAPNEIMDLDIEHTEVMTPHSILWLLMEGHNVTCEMFLPKNQTWIWSSLKTIGWPTTSWGPDLACCLFLWIKLCWNTATPIYWSSCNRDHMVLKAWNIYCLTFISGEGNGNPLQYSFLENPRDRGAWWAAIYGVAQSRTRLTQLSSSNLYRGLPWWLSG